MRRSHLFSPLLALGATLLLSTPSAQAQGADTIRQMPGVALDTVAVLPTAVDVSGWLLLDQGIATELDGAVENLYNFKFDKAEKQFRSLRRRYPQHPMPYFLLGLSTWWKIMPSGAESTRYDKTFYAYLDTTITLAERQYKANPENYEACFFLAAAYGFEARLRGERRDWTRATVSSKRALTYLQKSREANGLSPEFLFGEGLFNYYAVWISEEHPWLKPVLLFFPKGDRGKGLAQINTVVEKGFYTRTEARFFRMRILASDRERQTPAAIQEARALSGEFPDNPCFARSHASYCFDLGELSECETANKEMLAKLQQGLPGYDAYTGRVASYQLGYLMDKKQHNRVQAKNYYMQCVVYSQTTGQTRTGYCTYALASLAQMAAADHDVPAARRYYDQLLESSGRKSEHFREAKRYLKNNPAAAVPARGPAFVVGN